MFIPSYEDKIYLPYNSKNKAMINIHSNIYIIIKYRDTKEMEDYKMFRRNDIDLNTSDFK